MPFAQGSRSGLSYMVETTFGTTPTPVFIDIPISTHSISLTKQAIESTDIRSDRQITEFRHGNRQVGGNIDVEFRALDYDDFLESAFFGQITTSVLKNGITPQYLVIEDRALDIAQYRLYNGVAVNTMSMSIKPNAMVTASFGIIGQKMTQSATSVDAVTTAASGNPPFDSFSGTINEGGSPIAIVTGLDFQIDNSLQPTFVVGSAVTPQLEYGRSKVTGTITAYYQDAVMLNKFLNETISTLQVAMTDGANTYTFLFPRIKYSGADVPLQNEQSRLITLPFQALRDSTEACSIKLTKS